MCATGEGQQHRHRGSPEMLTCSKDFSMGMISVAAPAASQPLSVNQRKVKFVSLIVPAVNAEKMGAVGCCKAISFCEIHLSELHLVTETPDIVLKCLSLSLLLRSIFSSDWSWFLLQHMWLCGHPADLHPRLRGSNFGRHHQSRSAHWVTQTSSPAILAVLKRGLPQLHYSFPSGHLLLKDFISPWYF